MHFELISPQTLDKFLTLSFANTAEAGMGPRLLDQPGQTFLEHTGVSRPPTSSIHSDYLGRTIPELVAIFEKMIGDRSTPMHANCVFIVLDQQTLVDDTVCGVSLIAGLETLRADFPMSIEILGAAEINWEALDEGSFAEFYARNETVTVEGWEKQEEKWRRQSLERREKKKAAKTRIEMDA